MKKFILAAVMALFLVGSVSTAQVIKQGDIGDSSFSLGFTYAKAQFDSQSQLIGYKGIHLGALGYHSKKYYSPAKLKEFNKFFNWGTGLLVVPYFGWGVEYFFNSSLSLSLAANSGLWIVPMPTATLRFFF